MAVALLNKAEVPEVLQAKELGGRKEWTLDMFISEKAWKELGGKAGIKEESKKLLTGEYCIVVCPVGCNRL